MRSAESQVLTRVLRPNDTHSNATECAARQRSAEHSRFHSGCPGRPAAREILQGAASAPGALVSTVARRASGSP